MNVDILGGLPQCSVILKVNLYNVGVISRFFSQGTGLYRLHCCELGVEQLLCPLPTIESRWRNHHAPMHEICGPHVPLLYVRHVGVSGGEGHGAQETILNLGLCLDQFLHPRESAGLLPLL